MSDRITEIYPDASGGFRWRRKAPNGEITATSESYTRQSSAYEAARREFPDDEFRFVSEGSERPDPTR